MTTLGRDLERIVPDEMDPADDFERLTLSLHVERYEWAARFVLEKRALDLACGVGYGAAILASAGARETLGVDLSDAAIAYARRAYVARGLAFEAHDAFAFEPGRRFDLVVSFETIEHVTDVVGLMSRLASLIEPGGTFVGSVPVTVSTDANPFHIHDFTEQGFESLIRRAGLVPRERLLQVQPFSPLDVLRRSNRGERPVRRNLARYYAAHPMLAARRTVETLRYGFCNRYLIVAADKPAK
jgi:SAM-dependent methyltransferase